MRKKIVGLKERLRLSVFRSNRHIYAQIIDDILGQTLVGVHSLSITNKAKDKTRMMLAWETGQQLAQQAQKKGIKKVVFDRGQYRYHGRLKQLAEGARAGGLSF